MPILAKEPSAWPQALFDELPVEGKKWCEKVVARQLRSRNIPFFLPVHECWRTYQRRRVASYSPLFPGYVFALADDESRAACFNVKEVLTQLDPGDQEQLRTDLMRIHSLLETGAPLTREERLQPGMPARIVAGPLAGMTGTVVRNKNGIKFVLHVSFIQQGASIEVDGSLVQAD
jgi:transcriptional antiterminator RfaH